MKIIIFCGDRAWTDTSAIAREMTQLLVEFGPFIVRQGCCRGADLLSRSAAVSAGLQVQDFPAQWELHGKRAGPICNQDMLVGLARIDPRPADLVRAFHHDLRKSKGTLDMVTRAYKRGTPVKVING